MFLGSCLDSFPRLITFRIRHTLDLIEAGDCIADMGCIVDRLFFFLRKCEMFLSDMIAAISGDF